MQSITVELGTAIKYAHDGKELDGTFLEISAPTGQVAGLVADLKGKIGEASTNAFKILDGMDEDKIKKIREQAPPEEKSKKETPLEKGESIYSTLMMSGGDMQAVMEIFRAILQKTAKIAGEERLTSPLFDKMAYSDIEKALILYMGNFTEVS